MRRLFAISTLVLIAFLFASAYNQQEVNATGGAFPYTKHGGGTTDGLLPYPYPINDGKGYGVDRAINFDDYGVSGYYNNQSPEAGKYIRGECTHCHEPHSSFGESEPSPNLGNDAGPDPYLVMKDYGANSQTTRNYAELCWYCHEKMTLGSPPKPIGSGYWGFYQGKTIYQASSHFNSSNFYWPGTTGDPVSIWPRQNRSGLPSGNRGSCLNCHTPHGIKETTGFEFDNTAVPANMHLAVNSANVSADNVIPRQLIAWEEALCENCHDVDGPAGANIKSEIAKRDSGGSGHPVHDTTLAGKHTVTESIPITTSKHVECYDCHNPHAAKTPTGVLGDGDGGRITGMKYVDINGVAKDPAPVGTRQPFIYEICLKCHGSSYIDVFGYANSFPDGVQNRQGNTGHFSNKRKEFNPNSHQYLNYPAGDIGYNTSYHPVASPGRNGTLNLCKQLESAFGLNCTSSANAATSLSNLTINCTDCHNNEDTAPTLTNPMIVRGPVTESSLRSTDKVSAYSPSTYPVGPHGSDRNRLLRGNYVTTNSSSGSHVGGWYASNRLDTNGRPKFELCFLCHQEGRLVAVSGGAYTNFGAASAPSGDNYQWNTNLHVYHLNAQAVCHDCHHNVHSNVEAQNTIYGNGLGAQLPPDNHDGLTDGYINTHLINFGPQASGQTATKPRWYYDGNVFRCNLVCHGATMSLCAYTHGNGYSSDKVSGWCAG